MVFEAGPLNEQMVISIKVDAVSGTSLKSLVQGYLLTKQTEGLSSHYVKYCQTVAKVLASPEPLELGLVSKACSHLFLISRMSVRNVVTIIEREIALVKSSLSNQREKRRNVVYSR